jgi:hypothetical protein
MNRGRGNLPLFSQGVDHDITRRKIQSIKAKQEIARGTL